MNEPALVSNVEDRLRAELMAQEIQRLRGRGAVMVAVDQFDAYQLVAALQLAWRHPQLPEHVKKTIETFGRQLMQPLVGADTPQLALTLEQGWRPEFDR